MNMKPMKPMPGQKQQVKVDLSQRNYEVNIVVITYLSKVQLSREYHLNVTYW